MDPDFVHVRYVRYADEFLISVIGSHKLNLQVKDRLCQFLKDELALQVESKTTPVSRQKAFFLGTYVQCRKPVTKDTRVIARIALDAPMDKLIPSFSTIHEVLITLVGVV